MKPARPALLAVIAALGAGVAHLGCSDHQTATPVPPGQTSNLEVQNRSPYTLHVYLDGVETGSIQPNQTVEFYVQAGVRSVGFRERGETIPTEQGLFTFTDSASVRLIHDPAVTVNLRVTNNKNETTDLYIEGRSEGAIQPGTTRAFLIDSGYRDISFRDRSDYTPVYFGSYNLNTSAVVEISYR